MVCRGWAGMLAGVLFFLPAPGTVYAADGTVVYVSADTTGEYRCDGVNDEIEINRALVHADTSVTVDTVYLRGPAVYLIDSTLVIGGNTTLAGDSTAVVRLAANAGWVKNVPMIRNAADGDRNIVIRGFAIDGNDSANMDVDSSLAVPAARRAGAGYYPILSLQSATNIHVYDMHLSHNLYDAVTILACDSVFLHGNRIVQCGRDGIHARNSGHIEVYDTVIQCRTNSGIRLYNSNHAKIHDNLIFAGREGGSGIQIQKEGAACPMNDIEIYGNTIHDTLMGAFWIFSYGAAYPLSDAFVHIHHNTLYDCGTGPGGTGLSTDGGITTCGFGVLAENNVLDGCYNAGVYVVDRYSSGDPPGTGYVVRLRNTIVSNTRAGGKGVWNARSSAETVILENNCFSGNVTDYSGDSLFASGNISADPLFAGRETHDYHLRSSNGRRDGASWVTDAATSPCIDAGYAGSGFSDEPEPNGGRINIGRYGNTAEASKSAPVTVAEEMPSAFSLSRNAPNPFNPETVISYSVPRPCMVRITIYTAAGQTVETLVRERCEAGMHTVRWRPSRLSSGIFLCRMEAGEFVGTVRLVYVK